MVRFVFPLLSSISLPLLTLDIEAHMRVIVYIYKNRIQAAWT